MPAGLPPRGRGRVPHALALEALEVRYDHHSARTVLAESLARAGIPAAADYSPEEASRLAIVLTERGDRARPAVKRLLERAGEAATAEVPEDPEDEAERRFWN